MVLQKRINYGFSGYQPPPIPQAPRSIRKRKLFKKPIIDGDQMCAFDLLATVAGKLLLERETPCSEISTEKESFHNCCNEVLLAKGDIGSVVTAGTEILIDDENIQLENLATKVETDDVFSLQVSNSSIVEGGMKTEIEQLGTIHVLNNEKVELCDADNNEALDDNNNNKKALSVGSLDNNSMKLECIQNDSPSALWGDVNLGVRDDDEKFSGFPQHRTRIKACRPLVRLRDRGIKKLSALRYWKVNAQLRNKENLNDDVGKKPMICNGKNFYKLNRSRSDYPYKKKKHFFNRSKIRCHGGGIRKGGISNSHGKANGGAFGKSASATGQNASFKSRDSHVRLRIKSFRIPELLVELPETATVGSLKRTVMEAVTAILSGGLRVGVVMQGKKVGDDSRTLLQTGITHDDKIDALGFTLEPNPSETTTTTTEVSCENTAFQNSSETNLSMKRICDAPPILPPLMKKFGDIVESDYHMVSSTPDMLSEDRSKEDSRLVSVPPPMNVEALSVIPMTKSKRSLAVQRRIRRPFAVSEVEALVEAVEKLGTGRWRDVKIQAFDNAKHRTYVDLKDKWKTLVHTAKISPQQRRGQPVPQELLDRVLVAHAYWTHRQVGHQQQKEQPEFFGLVGGF
ncbi:telomere repeat-binding protein 2-like [Impatiens glandulifera]|uniref:telomere repeat-binding protein 2-like n=1 Tax=Impatiens glandulifera TaxID=253017 RepID=UPI001FB0FEF9|nr:telomere repeat-binding protein 2-like [Impatiens glandulifera]XP_047310827.1 telomere repeat-binding protein 2-like [Impatiens glandulifera]